MKTIVNYAQKVKEQHALNKTLAPVETDLTDASRAYAIGEQFIYNGELFKAKTAIAQHDALVLNTNYEAADNLATEIEALTNKLNNEIVTRSALGAKNILPFDLAEIKALNTNGTWAGNVYTYRDVDFTVNADGTVTANGTATGGNASIKLYNASANYEMLGKKVILNGCPSGGSATTYRIQAYRMGSADGSTGTYFDDGEGTIAFDALNNASGTVGSFAVAVYENATVTNLLFKPMVRLASDPDATYQPYAKTNRELTAENQTLTNNVDGLTSNAFANGVVNMLQNTASSATVSGVTLTVNSDKTVTLNGTSTAQINFTIKNSIPAECVGKSLKLTGCIGGSSEKYELTLWDGDESRAIIRDYGNGAIGTPLHTNSWVNITIRDGATFNNVIVKPMITLADMPNSDYNHYVPYAMTNRELTENVLSTITTKFIKISSAEISDSYNPITIADELVATNSIEIVYVQVSANDNITNPKQYCPLQYTLYEIKHTGDTVTLNALAYNPDLSNSIYTIGRSRNGTWGTWFKTTMTAVT